MISYELAKQLKEAGFFQYGDGFWQNEIGDILFYGGLKKYELCMGYDKTKKLVYFPTLSELIEACGKGNEFQLYETHHLDYCFWNCFVDKPYRIQTEGNSYLTPEEAVVNLWLKLHEKAK